MGFRLVIPKEGGIYYYADSLDEFQSLLHALGIVMPEMEIATLACEKCGHLSTGSSRRSF